MADRGAVMGDLRRVLRHRLGARGLVRRGVSPDSRSPVRGGYAGCGLVGRLRGAGGLVGLLDDRVGTVRLLNLRRGSAALGGLVRGCGKSRAAEGHAGDGRDHHLLNCVLVHVAPSLSVFRRAPLRRH